MILKIENQFLSRYLKTKMEVRKQRVYICIVFLPLNMNGPQKQWLVYYFEQVNKARYLVVKI